tara:strand:- start:2703 stop:2876 length:174 start_codon:yes stop_codon:yes gene_type:complete
MQPQLLLVEGDRMMGITEEKTILDKNNPGRRPLETRMIPEELMGKDEQTILLGHVES